MIEQNKSLDKSGNENFIHKELKYSAESTTDSQEELKQAMDEFLTFLEDNKDELKTGFGAFHTNAHSNW